MFLPPSPLLPKGSPDKDWLKSWDRGLAMILWSFAFIVLSIVGIGVIKAMGY